MSFEAAVYMNVYVVCAALRCAGTSDAPVLLGAKLEKKANITLYNETIRPKNVIFDFHVCKEMKFSVFLF